MEAGLVLGPHRLDYLQRLFQLLDSLRVGRIVIPIGFVFLAEPSRTDSQLEPSAADLVERGGHLGQQRRITKGRRGDNLGHHHAFGHGGNRAQRRVALQQRIVGHLEIAAMDEEMVAESHAVKAQRVGGFRQRPGLGEIALRKHHIEFCFVHFFTAPVWYAGSSRGFGKQDRALRTGLQIPEADASRAFSGTPRFQPVGFCFCLSSRAKPWDQLEAILVCSAGAGKSLRVDPSTTRHKNAAPVGMTKNPERYGLFVPGTM